MTRDMRSQVIAAIDIGSNSIKLSTGYVNSVGRMVETSLGAETVRLGAGLDKTGELAADRMDAAIDVLRRYAKAASDQGADRILAVATEATRSARNGQAFLNRVQHETGISVEIINGDREALLTFRGMAASVDLSGSKVIADIGGGSTEVMVEEDGNLLRARSLRLGSGGLTDQFVVEDPPGLNEIDACRNAARTIIQNEPALEPIPVGTGVGLLLTGGTGQYLEQVLSPGGLKPDVWIASAITAMLAVSASELAASLGAAESRARVLPAGAAIVAALIDLVQPESVHIARSGVRAGLLIEAFGLPVIPAQ